MFANSIALTYVKKPVGHLDTFGISEISVWSSEANHRYVLYVRVLVPGVYTIAAVNWLQ